MDHSKKKCPYCGEEIMAKAKKCRHCGEWLDNTANLSAVRASDKKKKMWIYLILIAVVVIGVIAFIAMFSSNETATSEQLEEQTTSAAEDYSIDFVSFDLKSLTALNMMPIEEAKRKLEECGWEPVSEMSLERQDRDVKVANIYLKDYAEDKGIYEFVLDEYRSGVGNIEFVTSSKQVLKLMETDLKDRGYRWNFNGNIFTIASEDTINSPIFGMEISEISSSPNGDAPTDTTYYWFVKKLPVINNK